MNKVGVEQHNIVHASFGHEYLDKGKCCCEYVRDLLDSKSET